ncbi:MAG: hypothetical protein JEZ07_18320 [Phycisphaerae bacterium]|nr:hypothetical protein [Phycisphaerae bacterium]
MAYDALGRRIKKEDCIADDETLYWYNNNWQVLAASDGAGNCLRIFAYGNYIDEVLVHQEMNNNYQLYYALQDHLYSVVALLDQNNTVAERTEYDSYGKPTIFAAGTDGTYFTADDEQLTQSACGNPYHFTGRRVDVIDGGNKLLQYSRNRYLDYETGRWLSHDPLGMVPDGHGIRFDITIQYTDGLNVYNYAQNTPVLYTDPHGKVVFCIVAGMACFTAACCLSGCSSSPPPPNHTSCEAHVAAALKDPKVDGIYKSIKSFGCSLPKVLCKSDADDRQCKSGTLGHAGGGRITICEDRARGAADVLEDVIHEAVHIYDQCVMEKRGYTGLWRRTPQGRIACMEIRAYDMDGSCKMHPKGSSAYETCIINRAANSVVSYCKSRKWQGCDTLAEAKYILKSHYAKCIGGSCPNKK